MSSFSFTLPLSYSFSYSYSYSKSRFFPPSRSEIRPCSLTVCFISATCEMLCNGNRADIGVKYSLSDSTARCCFRRRRLLSALLVPSVPRLPHLVFFSAERSLRLRESREYRTKTWDTRTGSTTWERAGWTTSGTLLWPRPGPSVKSQGTPRSSPHWERGTGPGISPGERCGPGQYI